MMDAIQWDKILRGYEGDPYRKYVMLPTILNLLPDLSGKAVLDVGTGNGFLIPHLLERNPRLIVGIDSSNDLLAIARKRLPEEVRLYQADLTEKLNLKEGPFDVAICNFVLNEVKDLSSAYRNLFNQLHKGATLIVGILHPTYLLGKHLLQDDKAIKGVEGYFTEKEVFEVYRNQESSIELKTYLRPLAPYVNLALDAGFQLQKVVEPRTPPQVIQENPFYKPYRDFPISIYLLLTKS